MYPRYLINIGIAAALVAATVVSSPAADDFGKGAINWTEGYVEAVGYGTAQPSGNRGKDRISARRAAEVTAQRSLLEIVKGVRIDSMTTVENSMLTEDVIKTRVDGMVKGAQKVEEKLEWEGDSPVYIVKMRVCLSDGINDCKGTSLVNLLNLEKREEPPSVPKTRLTANLPDKQEPAVPPVTPPVGATQHSGAGHLPKHDLTRPVTGIVITLDGRYFERSLLPVVVTKINDEMVTVYSAKIVKPSVIRNYGAVRYAESVDNALKISHLGSNVMVVQVEDITKDNMIIISSKDAGTIKETIAYGNDYLSEAKVVISAK